MSSTTGQAAAGAAVIPLASMAGSVPAQRVLSERPLRIALVAGEASGDLLGAGLVRELKARFPNAEFAGIGGDAMRSAGCQTWHDASELAVMGLTEVLRHLPRLLKLRSAFRHAGGVRIDHILGLTRMWLVPDGFARVLGQPPA